MTLFRQIAALISLVFLILLAVTTWNNFRHSSRALEGQLQSAAQNMATTLGVSIANSGQGGDPAYIETLFNVIFDSGYLARIELVSPAGERIHAKEQAVEIQGVPGWLVRLVPMAEASGESQIMMNWRPYGTLVLVLHPGYAYAGLYDNLKALLLWFGLLAGGGLFVLWWLLHVLLRPLRTIETQAMAISENRFIQNDKLPRTTELNRVARAMNRMVGKVQAIFTEQAESLNRYHQMLYRDAVTGLGNRRHFMAELDEICRDETALQGCLVVLRVHGLDAVKERKGYEYTDDLLSMLALLLEKAVGKQSRKHCARINDTEFSMYIQANIDAAEISTQRIFDEFRESVTTEGMDDITWLYAGLAQLSTSSDTGSILSDADYALNQAKASGAYMVYHKKKSDLDLPQGKIQWRTWLEESLEQHKFFMAAQPALVRTGMLDHNEVFVRLRNEQGQEIPAGVFMPVANALELDYAIEEEVFRMVLELGEDACEAPIAVNISPTFFTDARALASLEEFMREADASAYLSLQVETSHFTLTQHARAAVSVADRARYYNCRFGIDNLDLSLPLDVLQDLRPGYVKINARTLVEMASEPGSTGLQSLHSLTDGLDIDLVAVGVDSQESLDAMAGAKVNIVQGHYIGRPEELS